MAEMSIAGAVREFYPSGFWWADLPEEHWPGDEESKEQVRANWHPRFADRFQKLIFIGKPEVLKEIHSSLEQCLLTDAELAKGAEYIKQLPDPFDDWNQYIPADDDELPA